MDYITTSNIVLAWKCYNYATTIYTVYTVYSTVKFVYDKSSGITKGVYKMCTKYNEDDDEFKNNIDYKNEDWELV
jgi:hypothetical protein|tara:strand:- start:116 stop:340 length:225 start_codon:yes stop_codon:yes gene_type:complete